LPLLFVACSSASDSSPQGTLVLTDANDIAITPTLELGHAEVKVDPQMTFDWSDLGTDLAGLAVDPGDLTQVDVYWFSALSEADLTARVLDGSLTQAEATGHATAPLIPGHTAIAFQEFFSISGPARLTDFFAEGQGVWVIVLGVGDTPRWAAFLTPVDAVDGLTSHLGTVGGSIAASATAGEPLSLAAGTTPVVDWSGLKKAANGSDWRPANARSLVLARFDGGAGAALDDLFAARAAAAEWYTGDAYGSVSTGLGAATSGDQAFAGVNAGETWGLALTCDTCLLPLPVFATQLVAE
jgi:hypothetical protein